MRANEHPNFKDARRDPADWHPGTPIQMGICDFLSYDLIIDARSPREYAADHIPGAINLPVLFDEEYAAVGTLHRSTAHSAYVLGVGMAAANIGRQMREVITPMDLKPRAQILVYCFRGGKRSKLWYDVLKTVGWTVDVLPGGWQRYRRWLRECLDIVPMKLDFRVLLGPTGCGKTRLLHALRKEGAQVIDLEALAAHRGSLIGAVPGQTQPTQKYFDSLVYDALRLFDMTRPVWIEAESKRIGLLQLPEILFRQMHHSVTVHVDAPMCERVKVWREDFPHWAQDPATMVERLKSLKPLIGGQELALWQDLAARGKVDELFTRVMEVHYDPSYARSIKKNYGQTTQPRYNVKLSSMRPQALARVARELDEAAYGMNKLLPPGALPGERPAPESDGAPA
jgi:tRNA 2-selenouridine synthase